MAARYSLGDGFPVGGLPAGVSVLVVGPHATAPRRVALRVLAAGVGSEDHAVVVSADRSVRRIGREYVETVGEAPDPSWFHAVDCSGSDADSPLCVDRVRSPADLTGIGIGIVKATRRVPDGAGVRLAVLSLSTLCQYVPVERVFNFAHVLAGRVAAADYLGVSILDPTMHDPREVNTLRATFDRALELREGAAAREARLVGGPGGPTAWGPL